MALPAVLLSAAFACAQPVQLRVAVDRPDVPVGEVVRVDVELTWQGAQDAYAIEEWVPPARNDAPLIATADQMSTAQEAGKSVFRRTASYQVRADAPGTVTLSPARVVLKGPSGKQEYRSQALGFLVRPAPAPISTEVALAIGAVVLALVAIGAARRARPAPSPAPSGRGDRARERASTLRSIGHRDHREFFGSVLDALRDGLSEDAPAAAREKDRSKMMNGLESAGVGPERRRAVEELVTLCDEARFNPEAPGGDLREKALGLLVSALS
jgi:hypothetical protein